MSTIPSSSRRVRAAAALLHAVPDARGTMTHANGVGVVVSYRRPEGTLTPCDLRNLLMGAQADAFTATVTDITVGGSFDALGSGLFGRRPAGLALCECWFVTELSPTVACDVLAELETDAPTDLIQAHVTADTGLRMSTVRLHTEHVSLDQAMIELAAAAQVACEIEGLEMGAAAIADNWAFLAGLVR
jgi:hypothetical protein